MIWIRVLKAPICCGTCGRGDGQAIWLKSPPGNPVVATPGVLMGLADRLFCDNNISNSFCNLPAGPARRWVSLRFLSPVSRIWTLWSVLDPIGWKTGAGWRVAFMWPAVAGCGLAK